jgi:uncharacterized protein YndB with AHSA1/START domain
MAEKPIAKSTITIEAPPSKVWQALVTPEEIRKYMFGSEVASDWKEGSPITWRGDWKGKPYEDKGVVLRFQPGRQLRYTHYSPLSGLPDVPESYHTVTIDLEPDGSSTKVSLAQDNNPTDEARRHSEKNWSVMLAGLKNWVEGVSATRAGDLRA